jgi:hypothetical protein
LFRKLCVVRVNQSACLAFCANDKRNEPNDKMRMIKILPLDENFERTLYVLFIPWTIYTMNKLSLVGMQLPENIRIILTFRAKAQAFSQDPKRGRPILVQRYIYSKERGGGGVKTFLWKTFEVYVTSYQYLFQHTWLCVVPLCFLLNYDIFIQPGTPSKCQMYNNN